MMQTVIETPSFQKSAAQAGMVEKEIVQLIDYLAANPDSGDEIKGTGGCRKVRVAGRGKREEWRLQGYYVFFWT